MSGQHGSAGRRSDGAPVYRVSEPTLETAVTVTGVHVETAAGRTALVDGERLTFGRARECTVCLDPADLALSRIAGVIEFDRGTWWVANTSATRSLSLVDELGFRSVLPPGRRAAVETYVLVIVDGSRGRHTIRISVDSPRMETPLDQPPGTPTASGEHVLVSRPDRLAMVALFAGYLQDPPQ